METKLIFLDQTDPEFTVAFSHFEDPVMYNDRYGESLQYLGTVIEPVGAVRHEFRHRAVPGTDERKYWHIEPSVQFKKRVRDGEFKGKGF